MYAYKIIDNKTIEVVCLICETPHTIEVGDAGLKRLQDSNLLIQQMIPNVRPELREMIISGTCPECYRNMLVCMDADGDFDI